MGTESPTPRATRVLQVPPRRARHHRAAAVLPHPQATPAIKTINEGTRDWNCAEKQRQYSRCIHHISKQANAVIFHLCKAHPLLFPHNVYTPTSFPFFQTSWQSSFYPFLVESPRNHVLSNLNGKPTFSTYKVTNWLLSTQELELIIFYLFHLLTR